MIQVAQSVRSIPAFHTTSHLPLRLSPYIATRHPYICNEMDLRQAARHLSRRKETIKEIVQRTDKLLRNSNE